jgi:hypothetical protein
MPPLVTRWRRLALTCTGVLALACQSASSRPSPLARQAVVSAVTASSPSVATPVVSSPVAGSVPPPALAHFISWAVKVEHSYWLWSNPRGKYRAQAPPCARYNRCDTVYSADDGASYAIAFKRSSPGVATFTLNLAADVTCQQLGGEPMPSDSSARFEPGKSACILAPSLGQLIATITRSATSTRVVVFTTQYLVGDNPFPSLVDD